MSNGLYYEDQLPSRAREFAGNAVEEINTSTTCGLLAKTDGTCDGWQNFAVHVFGAQGITVTKTNVEVNSKTGADAFKVKPMIANAFVPGQGGGSPRETTWYAHALIVYNGMLLDPSYGVSYGLGLTGQQAFANTLHSLGNIVESFTLINGYGFTYTAMTETEDILVSHLIFKEIN